MNVAVPPRSELSDALKTFKLTRELVGVFAVSHADRMRQVCVRITGDQLHAEDALQSAWLELIDLADRGYTIRSSLEAVATRIAKRQSRKLVAKRLSGRIVATAAETTPSEGTAPFEMDTLRLAADHLLSNLDQTQTDILALGLEGRTQAEIAEAMGLSRSGVSRALRQIKALLSDRCLADPPDPSPPHPRRQRSRRPASLGTTPSPGRLQNGDVSRGISAVPEYLDIYFDLDTVDSETAGRAIRALELILGHKLRITRAGRLPSGGGATTKLEHRVHSHDVGGV